MEQTRTPTRWISALITYRIKRTRNYDRKLPTTNSTVQYPQAAQPGTGTITRRHCLPRTRHYRNTGTRPRTPSIHDNEQRKVLSSYRQRPTGEDHKDIDSNTWEVEVAELDYFSVQLQLRDNHGTMETLTIHNVYNPGPPSTATASYRSTIPRLELGLEAEGEHLVVGDFNLHHPWWGGRHLLTMDAASDQLVDLIVKKDLNLLLSKGTITREVNNQRTTTDLAFSTQWVRKEQQSAESKRNSTMDPTIFRY